MKLSRIVQRVSKQTEAPHPLVWGFTKSVMSEIIQVLNSGHTVQIRGLGTFYWRPVGSKKLRKLSGKTVMVPPGQKLRFRPSYRFRSRRINMPEQKEEGMNKYGVELDDQKTKTATKNGKGSVCPICQHALDDAGACPKHGTEPFEPTGQRR